MFVACIGQTLDNLQSEPHFDFYRLRLIEFSGGKVAFSKHRQKRTSILLGTGVKLKIIEET